MNKVLILFVLCAFSLNAQSKLYPNNSPTINLEQTIMDNTLSLADPENIITKVLLYNKETLERTIFENESKRIDINLDEVLAGLYTAMVYLNEDIIAFKIDVNPFGLTENSKPSEVVLEVAEKTIKHYRVISTVYHKYSVSKYNVFTEKQKNELIRKNIFDLVTRTGRKNTLLVYAVYLDNSEQIAYETEAPQDFELYDGVKVIAKAN